MNKSLEGVWLTKKFTLKDCSDLLSHGRIVSNGCVIPSDNGVDNYFCFEMVLRFKSSPVRPYSEYRQFLATTIEDLRDEGLGYRKIAQWLREKGYKPPRGKQFYGNHVYSILKRKQQQDTRLEQQVTREYRNFDLWFIERKLINSDQRSRNSSPDSPLSTFSARLLLWGASSHRWSLWSFCSPHSHWVGKWSMETWWDVMNFFTRSSPMFHSLEPWQVNIRGKSEMGS